GEKSGANRFDASLDRTLLCRGGTPARQSKIEPYDDGKAHDRIGEAAPRDPRRTAMNKISLATRRLVLNARGANLAAMLRQLLVGCATCALGLVACGDAQDSEGTSTIEAAVRHKCGNHICQPKSGETCSTCPEDCGPCTPACGDGICSGTETCS